MLSTMVLGLIIKHMCLKTPQRLIKAYGGSIDVHFWCMFLKKRIPSTDCMHSFRDWIKPKCCNEMSKLNTLLLQKMYPLN